MLLQFLPIKLVKLAHTPRYTQTIRFHFSKRERERNVWKKQSTVYGQRENTLRAIMREEKKKSMICIINTRDTVSAASAAAAAYFHF